MSIIITGTGRFIPENIIDEQDFLQHKFYNADGSPITAPVREVIEKFKSITGIQQRRYINENQTLSEIAALAAERAIEDAKVDREELDGIFMAHNYGDIPFGTNQSDTVPSLASRVKHRLGIKNPDCIAFDILFGCPGWIQAMITAQKYLLAGDTSRYLVIGAETLSRVLDPHDRDSMIYADGAAATVLERRDENEQRGILSTASRSFTLDENKYLYFGQSMKEGYSPGINYIKMQGRKIYEFALTHVPLAMKTCLDKSGIEIGQVKKILIHQANEKMDEAIIKRFYKLYAHPIPKNITPMSIHKLGNSSVATIPTLLDLVLKGSLEEHSLVRGDVILMASVGAGMHINAITYKF